MKTQCRPGDLAIILRDDPGYEENIGRIVRVYGPARQDSVMGTTWLIVPVTKRPYAVMQAIGDRRAYRVRLRDRIEHADVWMMPIREGELDAAESTVMGDKLNLSPPVTGPCELGGQCLSLS